MSKDTRASFLTSTRCNFVRNDVPHATKAKFAFLHLALDLLSVFRPRAFGDDDKRAEVASGVSRANSTCYFFEIKRDFGNQNDVGAASQSAMKRDPASMTTHDFDDNRTFLTGCGCVTPLQRIHHGI